MKTNCKNCGAPMDQMLAKCPYCGTRYLDLAIDADKPFYVRVKKNDRIYEAKVMMRTLDMLTQENPIQVSAGMNNFYYAGTPSVYINTELEVIKDQEALVRAYTKDFKG